MSSVARSSLAAPHDDVTAHAAPAVGVEADRRRDRRWMAVAVGGLAVVYLSLLNPYWVPSGDGEVYTAIARSLARGEGYTFNGVRAAIAPPGWPLVLAAAMKLSPEFLFLKLVTSGCMLGAMAILFRVLRRFASAPVAAGVVLLSGTLSTVYPLTFWMHTEAFFCLVASASLLLAFRVREGVGGWGHVAGVVTLLAIASFVRWPGALHSLIVLPVLLGGERRSWRKPTIAVACAASLIASFGTLAATRHYLSLTPEQARKARAAGATAEAPDETQIAMATTIPATGPTTAQVALPQEYLEQLDDGQTPTIGKATHRGPVGEYVYRVGQSGKWFAWLLWQPTRFGQSIGFINAAGHLVGWVVVGLLFVTLVHAVRRGEYFWLGLAAYTGGLVLIWPNPVARYYVPVAPFVIVGVLDGLGVLRAWRHRGGAAAFLGRAAPWAAGLFVASLAVVNLPLLGYEVYVFRSGTRFYDRYEPGLNRSLIAACRHVATAGPADARVAVSERYVNMGRPRYSKFGVRASHVLLDRPIVGAPRKPIYEGKESRPVRKDFRITVWLKDFFGDARGFDYFLYQAPTEPWRVWHVRLTPALQKALTGDKAPGQSGGWELYRRNGSRYERVDVPPAPDDWPRRVPGL